MNRTELIAKLTEAHESMTPGAWYPKNTSACQDEVRGPGAETLALMASEEAGWMSDSRSWANSEGIATIRNLLPHIIAALSEPRNDREAALVEAVCYECPRVVDGGPHPEDAPADCPAGIGNVFGEGCRYAWENGEVRALSTQDAIRQEGKRP